ncbi:MAG: hypothetical protein PHU08_02630 [Dehalococcoidales bacterium]|nr:hypothetical protein [Dehalococcoidales bacterium]
MQEIPIVEAAKRLGMSTDSIRRRISRGGLKARKVASPHGEMYLVEIPDDTAAGQASYQHQEQTPEVETLRKVITVLETELEARRREVQELHVLLQQAQAALPPGRGSLPNKSWWRRLIPWTRK